MCMRVSSVFIPYLIKLLNVGGVENRSNYDDGCGVGVNVDRSEHFLEATVLKRKSPGAMPGLIPPNHLF